jgi:7-cyano-7-deazaguanine synthase in queuosine biosynthesis
MSNATKYRGVIPFSGGIDSTAALYLTLTQNPNDHYLVFRVNLWNGTSGSRTIREEQATEEIIAWLHRNGINNFDYKRLSFDYSSLGPPPIWDSEVINFTASVVIQAHPEISEFIEGAIKDDYDQDGFQERLNKIADILYTTTGQTKEELAIVFPINQMTKYQVMQALPEALLALTWSCRYPTIGPPYTYVRCGSCPQCLVIDGVLKEHPDEFNGLMNIEPATH